MADKKTPYRQTVKATLRRKTAALALAAAVATASLAGVARADIPVRVGDHDDYTRLVFDFAHTTAYHVSSAPGKITLTFTTAEKLSLPGTEDEKLITAFSSAKPDAGTTSLVISVPDGVSSKDYRLDEKIVLDIYAPKKPSKAAAKPVEKTAVKTPEKKPGKKAENAPAPQTAENAPVKLVPAHPQADIKTPPKPVEKPAENPAENPAEKTAEKTAAAPVGKPAEPPAATAATTTAAPPAPDNGTAKLAGAAGMNNNAIIVDQTPPENNTPDAQAATGDQSAAEPPPDPTVVTLSSLEPSRLAVFKRFRTLWIVMDSETSGAMTPELRGPEAGLMGNAKPLKFKGGIAYRFLLPPHQDISVEHQGLTWRVNLTAKPEQPASSTQLNVDFDKTSNHARLMAQMDNASAVLQVPDPDVGDTLDVIAAGDQTARVDEARHFSDVTILPAAIGMVVLPMVDDLKISRLDNFVIISSPRGINATPGALAGPMAIRLNDTAATPDARLFDFPNWRQGGITQLDHNVQVLENKIAAAQTQDERTALLMKMALLYFANDFGQETVGVLRLVAQEDQNLPKNPNFIALRGAAEALAGHYDEAETDLTNPAIQNHPEVSMWLGYTAAATGRWRLAERSFPADNYLLLEYPPDIAVPFTIYMAESALRLGHMDTANKLLSSLDTLRDQTDPHYGAAIDYLKGEAARQSGNDKLAIDYWSPVAMGLDRLYHTKASLALTNLQLQDKKISLKQAIENIDNLRFAWRGDGLEVQILHNLGKLKVQNNQFLSGLEDMKTATQLATDLKDDPQPIYDDMTNALTDLFVNGGMKNVSPLEAVSVYNEFNNMLPPGETGSVATLNLADSLIGMDLLDKAEALLETQLKSGLVPQDRVSAVGAKLAAVYLLDDQPQQALNALTETASAAATADDTDKRALLKARALSQLGQTDDAIAALASATGKDALHLKADVLWRAKRWEPAAKAIEEMLPAPGKPLSDTDAQLVVNDAVAYKLAGNTQAIADLRTRYGAAMEATTLASTFGVVTRSNGSSALADRDTILKIAGEVDMFKGFLDSYKATTAATTTQ